MSSSQPAAVDEPLAKKQRTEDMSAPTAAAAPAAAAPAAAAPAPLGSLAQDIDKDVPPPSAVVPAASLRSWVPYDAASSHFPLQNLPYGVFSTAANSVRRIGVAIGDHVLDLEALQRAGLFNDLPEQGAYLTSDTLNALMAKGRPVWRSVRTLLTHLLQDGGEGAVTSLRDNAALRQEALIPQSAVTMHLPARIGDYTDFYSSKYHAFNVGVMFRGRANALQPNWSWLPVGYHGRASSVVVSGTPVHRPNGQLQPDESAPPTFGPCRLLDFELEMGAFVGGPPNPLGTPLSVAQAEDMLFGLVVLNDWSARDVQKWEYVPLGPFTAKNFATTISPWVVTMDALAPFAVPNQEQVPPPMQYLKQDAPKTYDIHLDVTLAPKAAAAAEGSAPAAATTISRSNSKYLYWTLVQQLVHHSVTGCNMCPGDLLGTGTISGPKAEEYGSMLELSWRGSKEIPLEGGAKRKFLQDGDTVNMIGYAQAENYRVGFGDCSGVVLPAVKYP